MNKQSLSFCPNTTDQNQRESMGTSYADHFDQSRFYVNRLFATEACALIANESKADAVGSSNLFQCTALFSSSPNQEVGNCKLIRSNQRLSALNLYQNLLAVARDLAGLNAHQVASTIGNPDSRFVFRMSTVVERPYLQPHFLQKLIL